MSRMETNHRRHRGLLMTAFSPSTEKSAPLLYLGSCLSVLQNLVTRNLGTLHNNGQKFICIFSPFNRKYRLATSPCKFSTQPWPVRGHSRSPAISCWHCRSEQKLRSRGRYLHKQSSMNLQTYQQMWHDQNLNYSRDFDTFPPHLGVKQHVLFWILTENWMRWGQCTEQTGGWWLSHDRVASAS